MVPTVGSGVGGHSEARLARTSFGIWKWVKVTFGCLNGRGQCLGPSHTMQNCPVPVPVVSTLRYWRIGVRLVCAFGNSQFRTEKQHLNK